MCRSKPMTLRLIFNIDIFNVKRLRFFFKYDVKPKTIKTFHMAYIYIYYISS